MEFVVLVSGLCLVFDAIMIGAIIWDHLNPNIPAQTFEELLTELEANHGSETVARQSK